MIYFDNNATTRVLEPVADAMRPYLTENFANPSSAFGYSTKLAETITSAKAELAKLLGAESSEQVIITSGATEANNLALLGASLANPNRRHIIVSEIEHPSVLETARFLERTGYELTILPVSKSGVIEIGHLQRALKQETLLVSLMMANNETGVLQPVARAAEIVQQIDPQIIFHTDATQAAGKLPVDLQEEFSLVDMLSLSAHKFHGPKGVGALFVRAPNLIAPIIHGGGQQAGMRSGTENPAGLVGMLEALRLSRCDQGDGVRICFLRDELERRILTLWPGTFILGGSERRLPNTLNCCFPRIDGDEIVDHLATRGIAISTGSACSHGSIRPSYVASAMGLDYEETKGCIRISLSRETTAPEVDSFLNTLSAVLQVAADRLMTEK